MRVALLAFVSAFFSIANGLKECPSVQCQPSKHPGAFYTDELNDDDDKEWECWDPDEPVTKGTDAEAEAMAKEKGFAGACIFADYKSTTTPEEVPFCSEFLDHNPGECHPGPETYWGACVTNTSEKWKCLAKDDTELIAGVAKGDCKFFHENKYKDVCRFEIDDKPFKCPTVPTYLAEDSSTCSSLPKEGEEGEEVAPVRSACFSLAERIPWSCQADSAQESRSCSWTHLKGKKAFMKRLISAGIYYDGLCLLPGSPGYDQAADWAPWASSLKEKGAGIGAVWILVLVLLPLAAAVGGCLFWQRGSSARQRSLLGNAEDGSEMAASRDAAVKSGRYIAD